MLGYLSVLAFALLIGLSAVHLQLLRKRGVNAFIFGDTVNNDVVLAPPILILFYSVLSGAFGLPLPAFFKDPYFINSQMSWCGLFVCIEGLVWLFFTFKTYRASFRDGIDTKKPGALITSGTFSLSRNPTYVGFMTFVIGMFLIYPNLTVCIVLSLFIPSIQRQVLREESYLKQRFGREYEFYCRKVRRYL